MNAISPIYGADNGMERKPGEHASPDAKSNGEGNVSFITHLDAIQAQESNRPKPKKIELPRELRTVNIRVVFALGEGSVINPKDACATYAGNKDKIPSYDLSA